MIHDPRTSYPAQSLSRSRVCRTQLDKDAVRLLYEDAWPLANGVTGCGRPRICSFPESGHLTLTGRWPSPGPGGMCAQHDIVGLLSDQEANHSQPWGDYQITRPEAGRVSRSRGRVLVTAGRA